MDLILGIICSYLIGAIPTAYIFGKAYKGLDIREHGSGNVGATNVFRVLGKGPGIAVLTLDILKGIIPVVLVADIFGLNDNFPLIILAFSVVIGHNWTVFLKFKGGKGVATSLGVLVGLTVKIASIRIVVAITIISWIVFFLISRFVSASSLFAAVVLPLAMVMTDQPFELVAMAVIFCLFVIVRHRANIKRLLSGKEPRVKLFQKK